MDTQQDEASPQRPQAPDHGDNPILLTGWMTRAEVAEQLQVSVSTLQRWECQRVGPPLVRLGRRVYYRAEAFREWLIGRERKAEPAHRGGRR